MTMQIYEVYKVASYFKDKCFKVFVSCQRRCCLELKNKTLKIIGNIYREKERGREREIEVCDYPFTTTKRTRIFCHKHSYVLTDRVATFFFVISSFPFGIAHLFR